jgi:predicted dehydrogenase/nucleoside-diphosphate-sugar epimerase
MRHNSSSSASRISTTRVLRTAIVGTGYIAEFHVRAIREIPEVELVSACDPDLGRAQTFARNWGIPSAFQSLDAMLEHGGIDCIHLLAPPDKHFLLAKTALQSEVHVFVEKPMCTSVAEADELVDLAEQNGLYLGASHNFLFTNAYQRLRDIVKSKALGPIDHVTFNHFCELAQIRFGPFDTWMLRAPGNVILETGPHLVSGVLDLLGLPDGISVIADRKVVLPGGGEIYRRWRVRTTVGRTAIDFNINFAPGFPQRTILVRGLYGSATVDFDADICTVDQRTPLGPDIDRYKRSRRTARQISVQARNVFASYIFGKLKFARQGNPYQKSIFDSVAAFYIAMRAGAPLDNRIAGRLGRDVIECCTKIVKFADILPSQKQEPWHPVMVVPRPTVLVLGGAGFVGQELIRRLLAGNYSVRAMVRSCGSPLEALRSDRLEIVQGDIRNEADLKAAMSGIEFVYHLARAQAKTWNEYQRNEVEPARLIGKLSLASNVKRLVYTGTIDSYYAGARAGTITEDTPLDQNIKSRNYYARAKAAAENILMEMHQTQKLPLVIVRPGIVIGSGGNPFHWGVGRFSENICEVWDQGNNKLPFVLVGDVAAGLIRAIEVPGIEGRSYNLIDLPLLTARDYLGELQKITGHKLTVYYRPIWQFYAPDLVKWIVKMAVRHPDRIRVPSYFDWESRTQKAEFNCNLARTELGWAPASDRQRLVKEGIGDALQPWLAAIE